VKLTAQLIIKVSCVPLRLSERTNVYFAHFWTAPSNPLDQVLLTLIHPPNPAPQSTNHYQPQFSGHWLETWFIFILFSTSVI
jgi:hypothetical protein